MTQRQLAEALGRSKPLSTPSISAYENPQAARPPASRLRDYATFFATDRSLVDGHGRLIPDEDLSEEELTRRDALLDELTALADEDPSGRPDAPQLIW